MKQVICILLFLFSAVRVHAAPQEGLEIAWADARAVPDKDAVYYTRYLDATHLTPADLELYRRMSARLQVNLLSRSPRKYSPREIHGAGGTMFAVDLRYIAETHKDAERVHTIWERFLAREPYYHQEKDYVEQGKPAYNQYGQVVQGETKKTKRRDFSDFLRKDHYQELCKLTNSHTPIVTVDWFFTMTCIEADRGADGKALGDFQGGGFGYYDFLGLKNRDDFFKLAGVSLDEARSRQSELLAVVTGDKSGVATNDRMIVRRAATDGFAWFTLDFFNNNLDDQDPLRFLNRKNGLKHQAERHFATLPNGLAVVLACKANGDLQTYAPGEIGGDTSARGKDLRIHASKSCLSCHKNGFLQDINDEVRAIYKFEPEKGYNLLASPNKEEEVELHTAYLRDFKNKLQLDRASYELAMREVLEYPPQEDGQPVKAVIPIAALEYREAYHKYATDPLGIEQVARGLGVTADDFKAKLKLYRGSVQRGSGDLLASHILAPLSLDPPRPVSRNHYETLYPLLQQMTRGVPVP